MAFMTQDKQLISLDTVLGKDKLILTHLEGTEVVSGLFSFQLQAFSNDLAIPEKSIVGTAVTCCIHNGDNPDRFIHGYVSKFTRKQPWVTAVREYALEVVPWFWFLALSQDCRIFQNKTTLEICETLFKQFGFSAYEIAVTNSYAKREYCVQYNETAFHFISRLLEEEGIFYFFRHEQGKHTLVMGDLVSKCSLNTANEVPFSQGSFIPRHITEWEHMYSFCSGEFSHSDYDFTKPSVDLLTSTKTVVNLSNNNQYTIFNFPGEYNDKTQGSQLSRIRMEQHEQPYDIIQGASNVCQFCPGTLFQLTSKVLTAEEGSYWLTSVEHFAKDATHKLYSSERETVVYENKFTCIPSSVSYRPIELISKPRMHGLQIARVVGPSQEEIYTDKYGRIKVQFIWDRLGKNDENSSCWLRVAQGWSGQKWGAQYIPRVGHEVIVDFLDGNPNAPIVVGSLYNANNMPPYDLPDNQTQSGIKSHSSPKGESHDCNEIRFEDKKGDEEFYVHAQKDFQRIVENNDTLSVIGKQDISIKQDRTLTVEEGGEVIHLKKGNQTVTLDQGNQTIDISQGNRETKISMGNDTLHLQQGNHSLKLDVGQSSVEALQGISLTVGGNSIKIDQTGITIQGLLVKVNGKLVQCEADAMMQIKGALVMIN